MDLIKLAISKPVGVAVGVILIVMFGLIGLTQIPIQLTPTVDRPVINVSTDWPGRSPQEIVDEVIKDQEEELKNVSGLKRMKATATEGNAAIELEFFIGTSIPRARQEVSDSLRQVAEYPEEVEEPSITVADGASENAIAWIIIDVDPEHVDNFPDFEIQGLFDAIEKQVQPRLERVDGVAEVNVFGGREREVKVFVDTIALAQRSLNQIDVVEALRAENRTISAGTIDEGKRELRVRLIGRYSETGQIEDTIISYDDGVPVFVKDVATVEVGLEKQRGFVRTLGHPSIAMNVIRQSGANVVDVMADVKAQLADIEENVLPLLPAEEDRAVGPYLRVRQVYDETTYIDSAIGLVTQNLFIGGAIAAVVLLLFLRSFSSTAVVAVAIPISVIGTFLVMLALGRTLNIISLAGLAFAVGMVVDNAIVVLENIFRRYQEGDPPFTAAYRGAKEVWGAIVASTLTTAAVFVPVLTIQEEAGQLFRDISLAIVASVLLSLVVSITVIPSATARLFRRRPEPAATEGAAPDATHAGKPARRSSPFGPIDRLASSINRGVASLVRWSITGVRGWTLRPAIIVVLTVASLGGAYLLIPPLDYLPVGNRNLVFGGLDIPPGLSVAQRERIAEQIEEDLAPYLHASADDYEERDLNPIARRDQQTRESLAPFDPVPLENVFIVSRGSSMFFGGTSDLPQVVIPAGQLLGNAVMGSEYTGPRIPDVFGGASQSSIFGRGAGGGNTVNVEISGESLDRVLRAAGVMYEAAANRYGRGPNVSSEPGNFNERQEEWRVRVNEHGRELGLTTESVGSALRSLFDGQFAGEFQLGDDFVDIAVLPRGGRLESSQTLPHVPVATPAGFTVPIGSVIEYQPALAPQDILRIEELPAVTIRIRPQQDQTVEELQTDIIENVESAARDAGLLDGLFITYEGTAAKLDEVRAALFGVTGDGVGGLASGGGNGTGDVAKYALWSVAALVLAAGLATGIYAFAQAVKTRDALARRKKLYGVLGALIIGFAIGIPLFMVGASPALILARMVWALLVTYLLMSALFESFIYPFVIMFSVPLAVVGGFIGLAIVHELSVRNPVVAPQQLDVLTMLGFVILIGVVVNNAILIVHQSLNFMRGVGEGSDDYIEPQPMPDAVAQAVRTRVRPIFMSVLTSVGGMLPLVLFPGAGSEMYRGLGSVVVGGLLVSTVFTLVLVPLLFSLVMDATEGLRLALANGTAAESESVSARPKVQPA